MASYKTSNTNNIDIPLSCPYARAMLEQQQQQQEQQAKAVAAATTTTSDGEKSESASVITSSSSGSTTANTITPTTISSVTLPLDLAEEWKQCPAFSTTTTVAASGAAQRNSSRTNHESNSNSNNKIVQSCPFKDATSPEEISKTLSQIPPSHFGMTTTTTTSPEQDSQQEEQGQEPKREKHAFMKTLAYLHSHGGGSGHPTTTNNVVNGSEPSSGATTNDNLISKAMATMSMSKNGELLSSKQASTTPVILNQCPVKPYLPKGWTFDETLEEYSLASIMSRLAQQYEEQEQEEKQQKHDQDSVHNGNVNNNESRVFEEPQPHHEFTDTSSASSVGSLEEQFVSTSPASLSTMPSSSPARLFDSSSTSNMNKSVLRHTPKQVASRRLSDALKTGTAKAHEAAESVHFVKNFIRGKIDRDLYALLVAQLFHVYRHLEQALDEHAPQHFPSVHFPEELNRTAALQEDVEFWHSDLTADGKTEPRISPATQDYLDRIDYLASTDPLLLLSHAYTRYLGDLSGGKILARVARRALRLDKLDNGRAGEGLRFYDFDKIVSFKRFKDMYRQSLNDLPLDTNNRTEQEQVEAIVREANVAFLLNMRLFEELDVLGGVGTSVRPLESVYRQASETTTTIIPTGPHNNLDPSTVDPNTIPPECPFAKTSTSMNLAGNNNPHSNNGDSNTAGAKKTGTCPWPFILLHDPKKGMQKWQTWLVIGLVLAFVYHSLLQGTGESATSIISDASIDPTSGVPDTLGGISRRGIAVNGKALVTVLTNACSPSQVYDNWKN